MRPIRLLATAALGAAVLVSACSDDRGSPTTAPSVETVPELSPTELDPLFARASQEYRVPAEILKAIGYVETRWRMVQGQEEFPGRPPAFGVMALRGPQLTRGAQLARLAEADVRRDPLSNIRAAAALLSSYADEAGTDRGDLGAWAPVVARYSGITSEQAQAEYVHNDVYAVMREGAVARADGKVVASLMPLAVQPEFRDAPTSMAMSTDYGPAIWRPSPNYNARPTGDVGKIHMVIIHTCEGSYTSCWSWLTNPDAGASAHYVVKEDGSEISQLVREADRAWHIGATYDCSLNNSHECWLNGYSSNHFTVGIEHGGYASQSSFPTAQIDASAKLSCELSRDYGIPRDRYHYVAHGQLQPYNRTDPGPNWPWTDYMNRINSYCNTSIIVDSNNGNNDTSKGYIEVSGNWLSSSSTAGYYGSGYYYASTQAISDPATFWFYLPAAATKTIDAWWTAGTNRSTSAPFVMWNAGGTKLGTVNVNQQINGGQWNTLGTYSFSAGWNKVQLSRWTTTGYVVIADAVRIR